VLCKKISSGETFATAFWPAVEYFEKVSPNSDDLKFFVSFSPSFSLNNISFENESLPKIIPLFYAYRWTELKPFNQFGFSSTFKGFEIFANMDLKVEPANYLIKRDEINFPIPQGAFYNLPLDMNFPRRGYLKYSNENFFLQIGRTKLKWGSSEFPLTISDSSPYFDNISFSYRFDYAKNKSFTYSYSLISVDPDLTATESYLQSKNVSNGVIYNEPSKTIVAHRLDFKLGKNFRMGVGELNLIGGKVIDLQDISPLIIFHNIYSAPYQNVLGSFDFSWVIVPNFMLYGEIAFDDIRLLSESEKSPMEYGLSFGGRFSSNALNGNFVGSIEFSHTSDWMYNCRTQPYLKFSNRVVMMSNFPSGMNFFDYPIGFKYGQSADMLSVTLNYFRENMEFKNQLLFLRKGNLNFENYYYENLEKTLTNYFILVSKSLFKNVFLKNLDIFADIHLQFQKKEKPRVDLSVGFEYSLVFKEIAEIFSGFIN
jgi:hypothetical protein